MTARTEAPFTQFKSGYFEQASGNSAPIEQDQKAGMSEDMIMRWNVRLGAAHQNRSQPLVIRAKEFLNQINERPKSITTTCTICGGRRSKMKFQLSEVCELSKSTRESFRQIVDQVFALRKAATVTFRVEEIQARGGGSVGRRRIQSFGN
ncbi:MAG: hypothetical protein IPN95_06700 [Bacteroidetes bacterium]|nr:hypothetical protein [Bacteroidota bacterium]